MSKVYNYMVLGVGLTFLLKFAGIPSGADWFLFKLGLTGDISGVTLGWFYGAVLATFALGTLGAITIGYFTRSSSESYVMAPVASGVFAMLASTFISIIEYTKDMGFVYYITWLIFVPLLLGFGIAIIQFWRGSDV